MIGKKWKFYKEKKIKNIALEVMLYETMFKRDLGAFMFKIVFTIKPKFKKHDDPFTSRLSSKNVSENGDNIIL